MTIDISIILASFLLVFVAELGDKTQLVAFSLTSTAKRPVTIFIATSLALSASSVLAALLGGIAASFVPQVTSWIAIGLFFAFGIWILFSREAPPVKDCFLKTISFETSLLRVTVRVFKNATCFEGRITEIIKEENSHASIFRVLLRTKRLFHDDINEKEEELKKLQERLVLPAAMSRKSFSVALGEIIAAEEAVRDVYRYFQEHLSLEHHQKDGLKQTLDALVAEENSHIAFFKKQKEACGE